MITDIYIGRNKNGQIISIGFSATFCDIIDKHPSIAEELLKKIEIVSHTVEDSNETTQ